MSDVPQFPSKIHASRTPPIRIPSRQDGTTLQFLPNLHPNELLGLINFLRRNCWIRKSKFFSRRRRKKTPRLTDRLPVSSLKRRRINYFRKCYLARLRWIIKKGNCVVGKEKICFVDGWWITRGNVIFNFNSRDYATYLIFLAV